MSANAFVDNLISKLPSIKFFEGVLRNIKKDDEAFKAYGEEELVGYLPTKKHIYLANCFPNALHEIAHIVEMNKLGRLLLPDLGMKAPGKFAKSKRPHAYFTAAAREVRVRTIETLLFGVAPRENGERILLPHWRSSDNILGGKLPFGRFKSDADIEAWFISIRDTTTKNWNKDRIETEWNRRVEYIRNWQETRAA